MLALRLQWVLSSVVRLFPNTNRLVYHSAKFDFVLTDTVGTANAECALVSMSFT